MTRVGRPASLGLILFLSLLTSVLHAEPGAAPKGEGSAAAAADGGLTIVSVTPYVGEKPEDSSGESSWGGGVTDRGIDVTFSHEVEFPEVSGALVVRPSAGLEWRKASPKDGTTIRIPARFDWGASYRLIVTRPFGDKAKQLKISTTGVDFKFPERPATLEFIEIGDYLELQGKQLVHLKRLGPQQLVAEAVRLPLVALASEEFGEEEEIEKSIARWNEALGKLGKADPGAAGLGALQEPEAKLESEVFKEAGGEEREARTSLPLSWREGPEAGGVYRVRVRDGESDVSTGWRTMAITDLGISLKKSGSELAVWVTRLSSAEVVGDAQVVLALDQGRLALAGATDGSGLIRLVEGQAFTVIDTTRPGWPMSQSAVKLSEVKSVLAIQGNDRTFAKVGENLVQEAEASTEGDEAAEAAKPQTTYAHVFTERGIYKPGDTVNFKATIRQFVGGDAKILDSVDGKRPTVKVTVMDPRDQTLHDLDLTMSEFGTVHGTIPIRESDAVGQWTLQVKSPSGTEGEPMEWGRTTFRVEEFQPPRHEVKVWFREIAGDATQVEAVVQGLYLAGGGVKHGKMRWKLSLAGTKRPLEWPQGYVAGSDLPGDPELMESGEAVLDEKGGAVLKVPLSQAVLDGRRSLEMSAVVLDFDGRVASGSGSWSKLPPYLVGIAQHPTSLDEGAEYTLKAVVVDSQSGKAVPDGELAVEMLEERWVSIQKRNDEGDWFWSYEPVMTRSLATKAAIANGEASVDLDFTRGGKQQVAVIYRHADGREFRTVTTFSISYGGWYGDGYQADRVRQVSLSSDRQEYVPGDTAKIRVRTPRPVKGCLLAIEREGVVDLKYVALDPANPSLDVPIVDAHVPNIYVSILAVLPRQGNPVYSQEADVAAPGYAYGSLSLPVRKVHGGLSVAIDGAGEGVLALPGSRHKLSVNVTDINGAGVEAEVALAVVDEAVLSLTAYQSPNLSSLFKVTQPLQVATSDTRKALTLQTPYRSLTVSPLTGGDGGDGVVSREWFDPVAFFQPALLTDKSGKAEVSFTFPDTMTRYRVYAVAIDRTSRHGNHERAITVTSPFYLEAGIPGFFTRGDQGQFQVALFNRTGKSDKAHLEIGVEGPLEVEVTTPDLEVADGDRGSVVCRFTAAGSGAVKLTFAASLGDKKDQVVLERNIREGHIMRTRVVQGETKDGRATLDLPELEQVVAGAEDQAKVRLELSTLETLRLTGGLRFLLQYPHGCIEQTSSGVLPLAALREMIQKGHLPGITLEEADRFLKPGVQRLLNMQLESGAFGYWPGYSTEHEWGTAYASLALTLARQAGFDVPETAFSKAMAHLETKARADVEPEIKALVHYVLAVNGKQAVDPVPPELVLERGDAAWMRMLAGAAAGKQGVAKQKYEQLKSREKEKKATPEGEFDPETFYSPNRSLALELLALQELDLDGDRRRTLSDKLLKNLGPSGSWISTHDTGWCVWALARYMGRHAPPPDQNFDAKITGGDLEKDISIPSRALAVVEDAALAKQAKLELSVPAGTPVFYRYSVSYPWAGHAEVQAKGITRTYERLAGGDKIKVGDLVKVTLEFSTTERDSYLALVDPLPAGFVAINSELASEEPVKVDDQNWEWTGEGEWIAPFSPNHSEMRQDRVVVYRDYNWKGTYRYTYVARAVMVGTFVVPPASLEPMYEPESALYSTGQTLEIGAAE